MSIHPLSPTARSGVTTIPASKVLDQFRAALIARDIVPPEPIIADGQLHRCNAAGAHGRGDAAYLLHLDGLPAGGLENWRDGRGWQTWRLDIGRTLSAAEREALRLRAQAASVQRREEAIGVDHLLGAEDVVRWHLHEARRLLAALDTPPALAAAIRLDTWLLNEARATGSPRISTTRVYQYGPACVRDSRDLKAALATMTERGWARLEEEGRRRFVVVNPALRSD